MATSNTPECFRECIGKKVVGVLLGALPISDRSLAAGNKTLVFDDGSGLTFSSNGSYWLERAEEVARAIRISEQRLRDTQRELDGVLELAGVAAQQTGEPR